MAAEVAPRSSFLFSLTSPFALALGYVAFGETINLRQGLGVALVLIGIVFAIRMPCRRVGAVKAASAGSLASSSWQGIAFGAITALWQSPIRQTGKGHFLPLLACCRASLNIDLGWEVDVQFSTPIA